MKDNIRKIIDSSPLFSMCSEEEKELILGPALQMRRLPERESLYQEGDECSGAYYLHQGKLRIFKSNREGKELTIEMARPGDTIGFEELLQCKSRLTSAEAIEPVEAVFIPKDAFVFLLNHNSYLVLAFLRSVCAKLIEQQEQRMSGIYNPVRQRVAKSLLYLNTIFKNGHTQPIKAKRVDVSSLAGVTRETATKLIKEFERESMLQTKGNSITIKDEGELQKIGSLYD